MPKVDEAVVNTAGVVGRGALVVSMLSAKTPMTGLPKGTVFDNVTRGVVIAFETIRELNLSSPTLLAKYCAASPTVFSFFDVRWTLGSENAWDLIITGREKEGRWGRGMCCKEMLLKMSSYRTGG